MLSAEETVLLVEYLAGIVAGEFGIVLVGRWLFRRMVSGGLHQ